MIPSLRPVWAIFVGSHSALSIRTSRVVASQPECSPPMIPAIEFDAVFVGDDDHALVEPIRPAVEGEHALAGAGAADGKIARDFGEVEHMQRPAAVERDVVGDVDKRADRP